MINKIKKRNPFVLPMLSKKGGPMKSRREKRRIQKERRQQERDLA